MIKIGGIYSFMGRKNYRSFLFLILCCVFLLTGCSFFSTSQENEYEVIGEAQLQETIPYEFTGTLSELYPKTTAIVLATTKSIQDDELTFTIVQCFYGNLVEKQTMTAYFDEALMGVPLLNTSYIFFIDQTQNDQTTLLFDTAGWLRVENELIYPSSKSTNTTGSLQQAKQSLERIKTEILMPPRFYYYRSLEELTLHSDYVFIGKLVSTSNLGTEKFFLRYSGIEESFSDDALKIVFRPTKILKGDQTLNLDRDFSVLLSPGMLSFTIEASNLKPVAVNYSRDTLDELTSVFNENADYFVEDYFVFANAASQSNEYQAFFINPVQGFVGIIASETQNATLPISFNAPFVHSMSAEDVIADIDAYISGEHVSVSYDEAEFTVNENKLSSSPAATSS